MQNYVHVVLLTGYIKVSKPQHRVYSESGFTYWNDGYRRCQQHQETEHHVKAVAATTVDPSFVPINEVLDKAITASKRENNYVLSRVVHALKFLSRQNLAFRGKYTKNSSGPIEPNSNLNQVGIRNVINRLVIEHIAQ